MPPRLLRRYGVVTLETGSGNAAEAANGTDGNLTAFIQSINFPAPLGLNILRVPEQHANFPVIGRLNDMTYEVVMTASFSALLNALGSVQTITVEEPLHSPGQAAAAQGTQTTVLRGLLARITPGPMNFATDEIRPLTYGYELLRYQMSHSGITTPVWDIDLESDTFNANGVSMFDRYAVAGTP